MLKKLITFILLTVVLLGKTFTNEDPPMIYIYHFVSYDSTTFVFHKDQNQSSFKIPFINKNDISTVSNDLTISKSLDPKLVSAMVTSAIAKYPQIKIAGESIQNRVISDNFMKLVKGYNYPARTDFIFIGEINTLGGQYELDLKIIDVSQQSIIDAQSFNVPFSSISDLRSIINSKVDAAIQRIIAPFTGVLYARVDSTSRSKVRWNGISIRPVKTMVGDKMENNTDEDFEPYVASNLPNVFYTTHGQMLAKYVAIDLQLISHVNGMSSFLAGEYKVRIYLNDNEKPFTTNVTVVPGNLNEVHISLPYTPPPKDSDGDGIKDKEDACPDTPGQTHEDPLLNGCPPPPPPPKLGNIVIKGLRDGVGVELFQIEPNDWIISAENRNGALKFWPDNEKVITNSDDNSVMINALPLGVYALNAYSLSVETFPGKHKVQIFSAVDTLKIDKVDKTVLSVIPQKSSGSGRDIVVYFEPFPVSEDEEYRLYFGDADVPFTVVKVVGEVKIEGFPTGFTGNLMIAREGFENAIISITPGTIKEYYLANVSIATQVKEETKSLWGR